MNFHLQTKTNLTSKSSCEVKTFPLRVGQVTIHFIFVMTQLTQKQEVKAETGKFPPINAVSSRCTQAVR